MAKKGLKGALMPVLAGAGAGYAVKHFGTDVKMLNEHPYARPLVVGGVGYYLLTKKKKHRPIGIALLAVGGFMGLAVYDEQSKKDEPKKLTGDNGNAGWLDAGALVGEMRSPPPAYEAPAFDAGGIGDAGALSEAYAGPYDASGYAYGGPPTTTDERPKGRFSLGLD